MKVAKQPGFQYGLWTEKGLQKERREMVVEQECQIGARQRQLEVHQIY